MIVLNDVCRRFSESVLAVGNVSLTIAEGEFVTLLGASGCGKTTLLRMLAGFDHPTSGTIHLAGEDVTDLPPYSRDLNMVFQDYALFPHLTVARNVAFGLQRMGLPKGEIATKVDDALRLVALNDKAERMPHELSGGQRQRVALARALVRGPRVLLLDEPLSALDAGLREAMQVELKRLHELLGITFVMVTHDQTEALAMSDRIVVMHDGRIAQVGSPDELYNTPNSTYVASFIGTTNMFEARALRSTAEDLVVETRFGSYRCRPRPEVQRGDAVFLGVRPEYLRAAEPGQAVAGNVFPCVVRDMLFHGTYTRFRCTLGETDEQTYWDWIPRVHSDLENRPIVGSEKALIASPEDLFVFTREETQ